MEIEQFIQLLNDDLCSEFQSVITYTTYAASVVGLQRPELREVFEDEAHDELGHAQYFADKIAALGVIPRISVDPVELTNDPVQMIETLLGMEAETVSNYSLRADQAKELGLHAIAVDIENILTDELSHRDELMMMSQSPTAF